MVRERVQMEPGEGLVASVCPSPWPLLALVSQMRKLEAGMWRGAPGGLPTWDCELPSVCIAGRVGGSEDRAYREHCILG